eukprot:Phypoly_transcript_02356.p1 GENE.Phypoly_transcript_02356~~Phypoly_transcript_02356.p1  ORF type:complete len:908 (+),score=118.97 Phypoly_transcript_02356:113-2836(+)
MAAPFSGPQHQGRLERALKTLFPQENVVNNARKEASIKNPNTGALLEVDVWYPELQICFEFQDDYHYQATWYSHVPLSTVQEKDNAKRSLLLQRGETLILIPCWWDGSLSSLQETITFHRPDLFPAQKIKSALPIHANPQIGFFAIVPAAGKLMLASFPSSAEMVDVTNENSWWLGEKYDGVRCFWNPKEKQMYSRRGIWIDMPPFKRLFGNTVLDGEIWCGRGLFLDSQLMIQSTVDQVNWALVRVICFDEASRKLKKDPFEKRYAAILTHFVSSHPVVITAPRFLCENIITLTQSLQCIIDAGGEGVILRKPRSLYESGRSTSLLKLKGSKGDEEALVSDVEMDGSLLLQLPDGTFFRVAKEHYDLHRQPIRGDIVTFSHDFQSRRSTPTNPVVHRIRSDMTWQDVIKNAKEPVRQFRNEPHQNMQNFTPKPKGYWSYDKGKNMRAFLVGLAERMGFDSQVAQNWYSVSRQELEEHREVRTMIRYYNNSLIAALIDLFPELNLQESKFHTTRINHWASVKNRRELYERFALAKGANPRDPNFWYTANAEELRRKFKGGKAAIQYYKGFISSVIHLFPEINFDRKLFTQRTIYSWTDEKKRKTFFDRFAHDKGFDPLVPGNWYSVTTRMFHDYQGYEAILNYYGGKLSDCLMQLYPDIGLQKSRFNLLSYWQYSENRRAVLVHFAKVHGFDPLVAENWYQKTMDNFSSFPETRSMLYYYNGKYVAALTNLFPNIGLDPAKFVNIPLGYWTDVKNRRALFTHIAQERGFDPFNPSNWYPVSIASLLNVKGAASIVQQYYGGSLAKGLLDMYPEIGLEESKFRSNSISEWDVPGSKRWYLTSVATKWGFDPLDAQQWVKFFGETHKANKMDVTLRKIFSGQRNDVAASLRDIFPELHILPNHYFPRNL